MRSTLANPGMLIVTSHMISKITDSLHNVLSVNSYMLNDNSNFHNKTPQGLSGGMHIC